MNLIGASRLVLFDVDWNPATDLQAMARIHRDGQKRPCMIYRFVMAGGIDEKIWQRQITKLGLASNVMEQKGGKSTFTKEELRDLFRLDEKLSCQTHDLLHCTCGGRGLPATPFEDDEPVEILDSVGDGDEEEDEEDLPELSDLFCARKPKAPDHERRITTKSSPMNTNASDESYESELDALTTETSPPDQERQIKTEAPSKNPKHNADPRPKLGVPISAAKLNMADQELRIHGAREASPMKGKDEKASMKESLMAYSHIDTSSFATGEGDEDVEALIEDDVLLSVLKEEGNRVSFVFAKTAG